jgi:CheY-like chemotaxis protein
VSDNGMGMAPDILARVTEPFFTTKPKDKGTGLGLAMARGFAEQSGGALTIASTLGHGTTVSIWLPVANDDIGLGSVDQLDIATDQPIVPRLSIILADDDQIVRTVFAGMLTEQGHIVSQAADAASALVFIDQGTEVDVLVSDLSMPGERDGLALIRQARALARATEEGPFTMLRKPVTAAMLAAEVELLMRRQAAPTS